MQQWEYTTIRIEMTIQSVPLVVSHDEEQVLEVGGDLSLGLTPMIGFKGPTLPEYLNRLGREGWELVSLIRTSGAGEDGCDWTWTGVLKRPLSESA